MNPVHCRAIALLIVAIAPAQSLDAQEDAPNRERRIAVVNIGTVLINYEKCKTAKVEIEKLVEPFKKRAESLKVEALKLKEQHVAAMDPAVQAELLKVLEDVKRRLEIADQEARANLGKRQEEFLVRIYKDVHAAIKQHAEDHGIQLVVGYGEPPEDTELFSFKNVNRKIAAVDAGSASLLYFHADLDISMQVVERLNRAAKRDVPQK